MFYIEQKFNGEWLPLTDSEGYILRFHNRPSAEFHVITNRLHQNHRIVNHYIPQGTKATTINTINKETN